MGAARKLQAEIDRTLKKVQEGIIDFDQIWDKVYDTDSQSQREKYEGDLKKEIKKLQRLRDQIKTWINGSDIKDKTALMDARRNIEKKMEQFKNCEKEAKTKAFSKAGLGQAAKLDPEEKARQSTRDWLNDQVEALQMQIDEFEAELEALNGSKRGKKPSDRQQSLEECVVRHQEHISRLEQCMRCLDNGTVAYQEIDDLRDMVEYYVNENREDDLGFTSVDETFAAVLDRLDDVTLGLQSVTVPTKVKKAKDNEEEIAEREREKERAAAAAVKAQLASHGSNVASTLAEEEKKPVRTSSVSNPAATTPTPGQNPLSGGSSKRRISISDTTSGNHLALEEVENDTVQPAKTVVVNNTVNTTPTVNSNKTETPNSGPGSNGNLSFASAAAGRSPSISSPLPQKQTNLSHSNRGEDGDYPKLPSTGTTSENSKSLDLAAESKTNVMRNSLDVLTAQKSSGLNENSALMQPQQNPIDSQHGVISHRPNSQNLSSTKTVSSPQTGSISSTSAAGGSSLLSNHNGESSLSGEQDAVDPMLSSISLTQLISSLSMQCADIKGVSVSPGQFEGNAMASLQLLHACNRGAMPQPLDGDYKVQLSHNTSRAIAHQLPASYPIHRLPQLENPSFYQHLDLEGLFYAFYFHSNDIAQYCAAKELKRQSWRYHVEHKSWFQRSGDPTAKTEDYEEGSYIYFDRVLTNPTPGDTSPEINGWCYRRKDDFVFRYDQLEDDSE